MMDKHMMSEKEMAEMKKKKMRKPTNMEKAKMAMKKEMEGK